MFKQFNISILFIISSWTCSLHAAIDSTYFKLLDSAELYITFLEKDQQKADIYFDQAYDLLNGLNDPLNTAIFYFRKSKLEMFRENVKLGEKYCKIALAELKGEQNNILYYQIKHRLGNAYYIENEYNKAVNQYLEIIYSEKKEEELSEEDRLELKKIKAYSYNNIAGINYVLSAENNAINYYEKSAVLFEELNNEAMLKYCYFYLASAYIDKKEFEKARENILIGLKMVDEQNNTIDVADFYLTYSHYFLEINQLDSAKYYIDKCLLIFNEYDDVLSIHKANVFKGEYLLKTNKYHEAIDILENGYQDLIEGHSRKLQLRIEELLAKSYMEINNYRKAYEYINLALKSQSNILQNNEDFFAFEFDKRIKMNQIFYQDSIQAISDNLKISKIESDLKEKSILNKFLFFAVLVFLLITVGLFYIVNRNMKINKKLKSSINENNILFKEVHHRVKNNFQIISSLMNLQKMAVDEPKIDAILNEIQQRINSMSLVHELLYKHDEVDRIDIYEYVKELVVSIENSYNNAKKEINYHIQINKIELVLEKAIPLGLILNEAITNAMKHAFVGNDKGDIWIELSSISETHYQLIVKDNGIGTSGVNYRSDNSLGLDLIEILSEQLDGKAEIKNEDGMLVKIIFEK
ncbi:hypothetical protein DNU06_16370 [Putridiphycobacter roseus]|uniref:histidine kinase n=1 Tax=Putridiphycobacter roseus TaxID=2219161 RepID=A0A2W1MYW4_9FLAO|nr:sensor histidine kinase [Putridiphycobacter roseus]PZE15751.1 hypothetical protein DNU06_16370 [Putridiphycobacter roseus]